MANVVTDYLFGEDPSTETIKTSPLSPEKKKLMNRSLIPYLEGSTPAYIAPIAAGASNLQNLSLQGLENLTGDVTRFLNPEQGIGQQPGLDPEFDAYFDETVTKPLKRQFEEDILPQIGRAYSGQSYGSERANLEARAARDFGETVAGERTKAVFSERDKARSLLFNLLEAGAVPRDIEQDKLTADYSEFLRQQNDASKRAEIATALLQEPDVENTVITNEGSSGLLPDLLTGIVGGAAGGFGAGIGDAFAGVGEAAGTSLVNKLFPSLAASAAGSAASGAGSKLIGGGLASWLGGQTAITAGGIPAGAISSTGAGGAGTALANPFAAELAGGAGSAELAGAAGADTLAAGGSAGAGLAGLGISAAMLAAIGLLSDEGISGGGGPGAMVVAENREEILEAASDLVAGRMPRNAKRVESPPPMKWDEMNEQWVREGEPTIGWQLSTGFIIPHATLVQEAQKLGAMQLPRMVRSSVGA